MKAKEDKIREAYGEYWESVKDFVDENGWCSIRKKIMFDEISVNIVMQKDGYHWRPKSLQGIENNNGWIKIESEDDLPKETGYYNCLYSDGDIIPHHFSINSDFDRELFLNEFTHYQPIQKPQPPIY